MADDAAFFAAVEQRGLSGEQTQFLLEAVRARGAQAGRALLTSALQTAFDFAAALVLLRDTYGAPAAAAPAPEEVRAPIVHDTRPQVLAGTPGLAHHGGPLSRGMSQESRRALTAPGNPFLQSGAVVVPRTGKASTLERIFRPPVEVMFRGTLEQAFAYAQSCNRWLLINVQDEAEFACQVLNRDTWSDQVLKTFVSDHFVFCQPSVSSDAGQWYKQFYPVTLYPHIAVLDPHTRARIPHLVSEGPVEAPQLLARWREFFRASPTPNDSLAAASAADEETGARDDALQRKRKWELTEEEQMAAAIAASLSNDISDAFADEDVVVSDNPDNGSDAKRPRATPSPEAEAAKPAPQELSAEAAALPIDTSVRIRGPSGQAVVRLSHAHTLDHLHRLAAAELGIADVARVELALSFPPKPLSQLDRATTVGSLGMSGFNCATLMLTVKDQ